MAVKKGDFTQFQRECLEEHNKLRQKHKADPLTLNKKLCNVAQEWANHIAKKDKMEHRPNGEYGENIFYAFNMDVNGKVVVDEWYNEIKSYNFTNDENPGTGHFTQVVWKDTKEVGVGLAKKWSWSSSGCNSGRQTCYKKTVTTYTSDGRQIVTTYEGGQPIGAAQTATCPGNVTNHAGASNHNVTSCIAPKGGFTQFELECLEEHNNLRARHGCPPLKLNRNLSSFANEWAQYLLSRNMLQHRSNNKGGENLLFCYLCEIF